MDPNLANLPADHDPSLTAETETLQTYREKLLRRLLLPALILGAAAILPALPRFQRGEVHPVLAFVYAGAFLILLFSAVLRNRLPFHVRTLGMLMALYVYGATSLIQFGATGSGLLWLMALSVLATVFLSVRAGLIGFTLSLASMLASGWLLSTQRIPLGAAALEQPLFL